MGAGDIAIIVFIIFAAVLAGLYFLNRWASRKMGDQQKLLERTKQMAMIYVIDKKKVKAAESSLPKIVIEKMPFIYKYIKLPLVKAKVGPQIVTLMCDKKVYEIIPVKKNVKVELSGMYITGMQGMKTDKEMKEAAKAKKQAAAALDSEKPLDRVLNSAKGIFKIFNKKER